MSTKVRRSRMMRTNPDRKLFQDLGDHMYASQNAIFELDVDTGELLIYPNFGGQVTSEDLYYFEGYYNSPRGMTPKDLSRVPYYYWENTITESNKLYDKEEYPLPRRYRLSPKETVYKDERPKVEVTRTLMCRALAIVQLYQAEHKEDKNTEKVEKEIRELLNNERS